jgi:hypothetical protein
MGWEIEKKYLSDKLMRKSSQYKNIFIKKEKAAKSQNWLLEIWWVLSTFLQIKRNKEKFQNILNKLYKKIHSITGFTKRTTTNNS